MASVAILVTGSPASGTTALAGQLAALLGCPVLSTTPLIEGFRVLLGPQAKAARLAGIARDTLWRLASETEGGIVVDAGAVEALELDPLRQGLVTAGSPRTVEVRCEAPGEQAPSGPLGAWPVVRVDTSSAVDFDALVLELGQHFL